MTLLNTLTQPVRDSKQVLVQALDELRKDIAI